MHREGAHTGDPLYAWVNIIPFLASASMFGVSIFSCPYAPSSPYPRSSARMKTMFGFCTVVSSFFSGLEVQPETTMVKMIKYSKYLFLRIIVDYLFSIRVKYGNVSKVTSTITFLPPL